MSQYEKNESFAFRMDELDPLRFFRREFFFPVDSQGEPSLYFCGNSLGLQPRKARAYIEEVLEDWARLGVEGHVRARHPFVPYHENVSESLARVVGARPTEVVAMNSLSVNLHLMMVSFYRPTSKRFRILMEKGAFPSDQYAVASQVRFHGFDPSEAILELTPRPGEAVLRSEDLLGKIDEQGDEIALVLLGNVNYLTGQALDMQAIAEAGHRRGCRVGFDLAHGVGNLRMKLHDWGVDFAVWCSYKYLNAGPGATAGCFVHERHANDPRLPKFAGWWGHNKATRFQMGPSFDPIPGAESWQLSMPAILQMAVLRASLEIFDEATMDRIRAKGDLLTGYLEYLLDGMPQELIRVITPRDPSSRGSQLSLRISPQVAGGARGLLTRLAAAGVVADFREPDVIRIAPAPLYNSFLDVYRFARILEERLAG